jgi:hypothetical protein
VASAALQESAEALEQQLADAVADGDECTQDLEQATQAAEVRAPALSTALNGSQRLSL